MTVTMGTDTQQYESTNHLSANVAIPVTALATRAVMGKKFGEQRSELMDKARNAIPHPFEGSPQEFKDHRQVVKDAKGAVRDAKDQTKAAEKASEQADKTHQKAVSRGKGAKRVENLAKASEDAGKAARAAAKDIAIKEAERTAARRGAVSLGAKAAVNIGSRMIGRFAAAGVGMLIPGPGWVVGAALMAWTAFDLASMALTWLSSKDNPAYDAEPWNTTYGRDSDRTQFLPLLGTDGDRDDPIQNRYDKAMIQFNEASLNWLPDDTTRMWHPTAPAVDKVPDHHEVTDALNGLQGYLSQAVAEIGNLYKDNSDQRQVAKLSQHTTPLINSFGKGLKDSFDNIDGGVGDTVKGAQDIYQKLRDANAANRNEITNSGTAANPFTSEFWTRDLNYDKMTDLSGDVHNVLTGLDAAHNRIVGALNDWVVQPVTPKNTFTSEYRMDGTEPRRGTQRQQPAAPFTPPPGGTPTPGATPAPAAVKNPEDKFNDLLSKLAKPQTPPMSMPPMGNPMSGMGSPMPAMGGGKGLGGDTPMPTPKKPDDTIKDDLAKLLAEKKKEQPKATPGTEGLVPPAAKKDPLAKPDDKPKTGEPGKPLPGGPTDTGKPGAPPVTPDKNTVRIGSKDITFDSPKTARMADILAHASKDSPVTLASAASQAGLHVPPAGQDIGQLVSNSELQPGNVVINKDGHGYVYLGGDDALGEDGKVVKLADVAKFDGTNQGLFRLLDTGSPSAQPAAYASPGETQQTPAAGNMNAPAGNGLPGGVTPGQPATNAAPILSTQQTAGSAGQSKSGSNGPTGLNPNNIVPGI